jgi:SM-20-related protein
MSLLEYDALERTKTETEPYEWLIVPDFVKAEVFDEIIKDYPRVPGPGSHPPSELAIRGRFAELMAEMDGPRFRDLIEEKFDVDLSDKPTMYTVRGFCRKTDGKIHTDSETKVITVLLYMNQRWEQDGGRLRVLKNGTDLNDYVAEVPPHGGTLLVFKRSSKSWHGHEPYEGQRRAVQMNWVTGADVVAYEQRRHRISSTLKKLNPRNWGAPA